MNRKRIVIGIIAGCAAFAAVLAVRFRIAAAPSMIVDSTTSLGTSQWSQRRIVRTTNGTNSNRVFAIIQTGSSLDLYYSDNSDAASPTWSSVVVNGSSTYNVADMVWDESNNVLYMCYAARSLSNNNNRDVFYRRISTLGSTPTVGAQQTALNGTAGADTYTLCNIEIAGDSGTNKVFVFGNSGTAGGNTDSIDVVAGTLNSDTPTWTSPFTIRSWTAAAGTGVQGLARMNTNKLVMFYHDGTNYTASRHDDSSAAAATSGWDALDGTDNSQTIISADTLPIAFPVGSAVGSPDRDIVWFAWQAGSDDDYNTQSWQETELGTEYEVASNGSSSAGPVLTTDGGYIYIVYRNNSDTSTQVFQARPMADGTSAWPGTEIILDEGGTENLQFPNVAKKLYQGKLDLITNTSDTLQVRHASSYQVSGYAYTESASSPYEGTEVWSKCDSMSPVISISVAGGTKYTTWCDATTGYYSFVLPQPAAADSDIAVFYNTDEFIDNPLLQVGHWKLDEAAGNTCTGGEDSCDSTASGNDGVWQGDAVSTAGTFTNGVTLDGTGDYVAVSEADADGELDWGAGDGMTASLWINPTSLPGAGTFDTYLGKNNGTDGWFFQIDENGKLELYVGNGGSFSSFTTTSNIVSAGSWQHIAFTINWGSDASLKLYHNGTSYAYTHTGTSNLSPPLNNHNLAFGANGDGSEPATGKIDDIRLHYVLLPAYFIGFMHDFDTTVDPGRKAVAYTHNSDTVTDITNLNLYEYRTLLRSESSTSITNADINTYDKSNDPSIPIASDGTHIVADLGTKIIVNSGDTFAPGGNVTTPKLHIKGTYTGGSESLIVYGGGISSSCDSALSSFRPLCIDGGTFTANSNSTLFSASSNALIQNATYNTLTLNPGANGVTHTLMAGTFTVNGALSMGNGLNSSVTITAASNATTLTANSSLTIATNTAFTANGSNTTTVKGNWTNNGTFTHSSGAVSLAGADSSTQTIAGNTTFYNLTASTSSNAAGRTLRFTAGSTQTVAGTWTVQGFSGKVITLESSAASAWTINPAAASVDYADVSYSTNTGAEFCATHSNDGGNNTDWDITTGASCESPPTTPSLDSPPDTATGVSVGPALLTTATDPDSDYLRYKIEMCTDAGMTTGCQTFDQTASQTGWSGQNTETGTAYTSGTQASYTIQTPLSNSSTYYWRSYAKDPGGSDTWSTTQGTPYSFTTAAPGSAKTNLEGVNLQGISVN